MKEEKIPTWKTHRQFFNSNHSLENKNCWIIKYVSLDSLRCLCNTAPDFQYWIYCFFFFNFSSHKIKPIPSSRWYLVSLTQNVSAIAVSKNFHTETFHSVLFWSTWIHPHALYCISLDTFNIIFLFTIIRPKLRFNVQRNWSFLNAVFMETIRSKTTKTYPEDWGSIFSSKR